MDGGGGRSLNKGCPTDSGLCAFGQSVHILVCLVDPIGRRDMATSWPVQEAKTRFNALIEKACGEGPQTITR